MVKEECSKAMSQNWIEGCRDWEGQKSRAEWQAPGKGALHILSNGNDKKRRKIAIEVKRNYPNSS